MTENVNKFLDAVDQVLNSNTLLLVFPPLMGNSPEKYLSEILSSGDFEQEFLKQDREREWYNYHSRDAQCIPRDTTKKLIRQTDPALDACTFAEIKKVLLAMLTLQTLPGRYFSSPYGRGGLLKKRSLLSKIS